MRELREEQGLTKTQAAHALGLSPSAYARCEDGMSNVTTSLLIAMAIYYDTSTDYILGRTNRR